MKNINFSPMVKSRSQRYGEKRKLALFIILIVFFYLIIIFWYNRIDFQKELRLAEQTKEDNSGKVDSNVIDSVIHKETRIRDGYYLKIFSCIVKQDMEKVIDYLMERQFFPLVIREKDFSLMYNVYVEPTASLPGDDLIEKLQKDGFSVYIQENLDNHNQTLIRVGSCYYLRNAECIVENLKLKKYSGTILYEKIPVKVYSIYLGEYPNIGLAMEEQKRLVHIGFQNAVMVEDLPYLETQN